LQATKLLAQINGKLQKVKLQRENVSNLLRQPALFAFTPVLQWPLFKVYGGKTVCGGNFWLWNLVFSKLLYSIDHSFLNFFYLTGGGSLN